MFFLFGSSLFYSGRIFDEKKIEIILNVMYSVTTNKQIQTRLKVGHVPSFFCEITVHTALFLCDSFSILINSLWSMYHLLLLNIEAFGLKSLTKYANKRPLLSCSFCDHANSSDLFLISFLITSLCWWNDGVVWRCSREACKGRCFSEVQQSFWPDGGNASWFWARCYRSEAISPARPV